MMKKQQTHKRALSPSSTAGGLAAPVFLLWGALLPWGSLAGAAPRPAGPMPENTSELIAEGHGIYVRRCSFCHGLLGDGEGPAADFMDPRPRDFTLGTFKFRTTQSGELPTDDDLFRTVSRGLPGTGMQAFDSDLIKNGLSEHQRWAVISYIKTFAPEFDDPDFDPVATGKVIALPEDRAPYNADSIAKGKAIFERAKCWECHGKLGRGDGQKSFDRKDDWGFPIRIRNLTLPWKIKGGTEVEDIYMRFSTGISGTPMPSFVKALNEEDRWYLANFIKSFQHQQTENEILFVAKVEGELPKDPADPAWAEAEPMDIRLTGQVVAAPRWQNPSIELVTLRAVYNDTDIVFLVEWDDPFKDTTHKVDQEFDAQAISRTGAFNSYVPPNGVIPRKLETFRDAIALQFPVKPIVGQKKPHFFRGDSSKPVNLWHWKADLDAVQEATARGWKQAAAPQAADQQQVDATATWVQGRWSVVMTRTLSSEDKNDVQFSPGRLIPIAVNAWDGSNGEHGMIMSLSSWSHIYLEMPTPARVYVYALLAVLLAWAAGVHLVRNANRNKEKQT